MARFLTLNWSLLIFIRENAPPVFFENYSAEKRWSGFSPYLHVQLIFSVNRPILWQMNRDFAVMILYVDCRESLFDYSRAKCFWKDKSNIILWWCYLGRCQSFKMCMGCRLIMFLFFFQEVRVNNGPQSIRVKDSGWCFIHAWRKELRQQIWHDKDVLDDKIYQTNVAI